MRCMRYLYLPACIVFVYICVCVYLYVFILYIVCEHYCIVKMEEVIAVHLDGFVVCAACVIYIFQPVLCVYVCVCVCVCVCACLCVCVCFGFGV